MLIHGYVEAVDSADRETTVPRAGVRLDKCRMSVKLGERSNERQTFMS